MGAKSSAKVELKKGPWTREEDQKLLDYIEEHGHGSWHNLPAKAGLQRCGTSCRLRWTNYLRPDIKRGKFSTHEEKTIIRLHALFGNRWSAIAAHLPKRTDNEIKNYWNTRLKKRLTRMGIDPATHKLKDNAAGYAQSRHAAALSHMTQWETARLEAEARLARESKLMSNLHLIHKATAPAPLPPPQLPPPCLDVLRVWQATTTPSCFFSTPGSCLESPTSTLNFSCNSLTIPTVNSSIMASDVTSMNNYGVCEQGQADSRTEIKGKMENSLQPYDYNIAYPVGNDCDKLMMGSMDVTTFDLDSDGYNMACALVGEFEDSKNYWNYLLNLVSSPMESPSLSG